MPLHPDARAFLDRSKDVPQPPDHSLQEVRDAAAALLASAPGASPVPLARVEDLTIPGGDGQDMIVRIYVPEAEAPLPVLVWTRGGSFTRTVLDHFDHARRALASSARCIIVAVDQRLSPETQFPGPLEDGYAALSWAAEHAKEIGGDPSCIGIGGESSGGNLAAALALLARDRRMELAFQVLCYPVLDGTLGTRSMTEYAEGYFLTKRQLDWAFDQYAPGIPRSDPSISPLFASDLAGLPPTVILTIEYDPLRDEGEAYADRLIAAGVPVRHERIEGYLHHFPGPDALPTTARLLRQTLADLLGRRS